MKKTLLATLVLGTSLALTGCFDKDTKESATNAATKAVKMLNKQQVMLKMLRKKRLLMQRCSSSES